MRTGRVTGVIDPGRAEVLPSGVELERYLGKPHDRSGLLEAIEAGAGSLIVGMIAGLVSAWLIVRAGLPPGHDAWRLYALQLHPDGQMDWVIDGRRHIATRASKPSSRISAR